MTYFLNLFSPETWQAFLDAGSTTSGFSRHQRGQAERSITQGDIFICYLVRLGRWCGALRIDSGAFIDETPLFKRENDPFVVRFAVTPIVALTPELALPVRVPAIWTKLSWTKDIVPGSIGWGANFQRSLRAMATEDAEFLLNLMQQQEQDKITHPLTASDQRALKRGTVVRTTAGEISVEIPDDEEEIAPPAIIAVNEQPEARESHTVQALVAAIGAKMGFKIWIPKVDRQRVKAATTDDFTGALIDVLPMNYNDATIQTIEQIDVIWLRGRSIARAFEIEHTTAIYSGLLRMADLVALQPDINIPLHIVAPDERRESVLDQIKRPVFSLLETGPLAERCSLLTYSSMRELGTNPHLKYLNDAILEEYQLLAQL
jgi:hypothetical protein